VSLRLLEVGAVRPDNYRACESWIDVTAIDLHSRHPSILEQDFLRMDQSRNREAWDIISLSLVLNFVSDGKERGMLPVFVMLPSMLNDDTLFVQGECSSRRIQCFAMAGCALLLCVNLTNYKFTLAPILDV
jgi:25S rRNA (adenine(2142)-N(1))-methyltransferase, Bmt2